MSSLLLLTNALQPSTEVLPALGLLLHNVRVAPAEGPALVDTPGADVILIDGRRDLPQVRSLCQLLRSTGPGSAGLSTGVPRYAPLRSTTSTAWVAASRSASSSVQSGVGSSLNRSPGYRSRHRRTGSADGSSPRRMETTNVTGRVSRPSTFPSERPA